MARIRALKPEFFDDEELCSLSPYHRLCFAGLWCQADKEGRLEDRPKRIKARILPFDDLDMDTLLSDLARAGFLVRYMADGKAFIAIKASSWKKHQRPRPDEPESVIPEPDEHTVVYASLGANEALGAAMRRQPETPQIDTAAVMEPYLRSDGRVSVESLRKGKGKRDQGEEGEEGSDAPLNDAPPTSATQALMPVPRVCEEVEAVLTFPVIGKGGPTWILTSVQIAQWESLFPGLPVVAECRKALAWVLSKPARRKTQSGMNAFLTRWLTRAVDDGRGGREPTPALGQRSKLTAALQEASKW